MPLATPVIENYRMNVSMLRTILDKTPDSVFATTPADGVQPVAWQLGHIIYALAGTAGMLGKPVQLATDYSQKYGMGTPPPDANTTYEPIETMRQDLDTVVQAVDDAIATVDDGRLEEPEPNAMMQQAGITTIGSMITFLTNGHLAYHVGQLSACRRVQGQPPALGF
ncbi:MAG: DinB family protein [Planctomycetota bacterium]